MVMLARHGKTFAWAVAHLMQRRDADPWRSFYAICRRLDDLAGISMAALMQEEDSALELRAAWRPGPCRSNGIENWP
jgi:phytoene/squalene synthetase